MIQIADMSKKLIFIVGSPRSGSTLLERMISSHPAVAGGPEPHLLTPLAHLGYYENIDKAPYDHLRAVAAQREFVNMLPNGENDYLTALRAYCFFLYSQQLKQAGEGKTYVLDKTPAYALVLPFIEKVFPEGKFVVLTRHPAAIFSSYAQSFFEDDWQAAHDFNPIIERYIPAIARFLQESHCPKIHFRYEDLVLNPAEYMERLCRFLDLPFDSSMVEYGKPGIPQRKGLGDPIGVNQHTRPVTTSIEKWVELVQRDSQKEKLLRKMISFNSPDEYRTLGYDPETLLEPLNRQDEPEKGQVGKTVAKKKKKRGKTNTFTWERRVLHLLRKNIHRNSLGKLVKKTRFFCDVLLR
ncbi:sulfotransferase [bacterium]|nr:sulfotransferase [candidate division CSSED10-310 bacterium]